MGEPRAVRVLRADCNRCVGLCCVAPAFAESADFAFDKFAGDPCPNLSADHRCVIHGRLREAGFPGCVVYDCFGAGQRVSSETFPGADWRTDGTVAAAMFEAFELVRSLHELLWYVEAALALPAARPLEERLLEARDATDVLAARSGRAGGPGTLEVSVHRGSVAGLLREASALARAPFAGTALDRRGADLTGADLRTLDLRGADLRGASLLGADLRDLDLTLADVTGADLRAADLRGANTAATLFLTASQLEAAIGDPRTIVPNAAPRPEHWA